MSAFAFVVCSETEILLLSEGLTMLTYNERGDKMKFSKKSPKFLKLNDHVAIGWVGNQFGMRGVLEDNREDLSKKSNRQIAEFVEEGLEFVKNHMKDRFKGLKFTFDIIGFNGKKIERYHFSNPDTSFTKSFVKPGQAACTKIPGEQPFHVLLQNELKAGSSDNLIDAAKNAFEKMIRRAEKRGEEVGGTIFSETLTRE